MSNSLDFLLSARPKSWSDKRILRFMALFVILLFPSIFMQRESTELQGTEGTKGTVLQKNNFWQCYWYINCPKLAEPVLVYRLTRPFIDRSIYHST